MDNLLIHPKTRSIVDLYLSEPTHALLLVGQKGVGLKTLAKYLAGKIADKNVVVIAPKLHKNQKTANINTEDIRELSRITNNSRTASLVIIIDAAEQMTAGAPEAFLKALEEPVENLHYILTSHNTNNLPKTILSRVQTVEVAPSDTSAITSDIKPHLKQRQIEFIANGLPAEIHRLSEDDLYFREKARLYEQAKVYLNGDAYERLAIIAKFKNRDEALEFLLAVSKLSQIKPSNVKKLQILSQVVDNLNQNGNIKAQLTYLATNW